MHKAVKQRMSALQSAMISAAPFTQRANAGAVLLSRQANPNIDEFDDTVILKTFGEIPNDFRRTQA